MKGKTKIILSIILLIIGGIAFNNIYQYNQERINTKIEIPIGDNSMLLEKDSEVAGNSEFPVIMEDVPEDEVNELEMLDGFEAMLGINPNFIGWISIPDTEIEYPICQDISGENYYLKHDFLGNQNSHGALFTEKDVDLYSNVVNIYGHNMKDGTMFSNLDKFLNSEFFETHKSVSISNLYEEKTYTVVAVVKDYVHTVSDKSFKFYNYVGNPSEEEFNNFKEFLNQKSVNSRDLEELTYDSQIIQLITCSYHVENGRLILVLKGE